MSQCIALIYWFESEILYWTPKSMQQYIYSLDNSFNADVFCFSIKIKKITSI